LLPSILSGQGRTLVILVALLPSILLSGNNHQDLVAVVLKFYIFQSRQEARLKDIEFQNVSPSKAWTGDVPVSTLFCKIIHCHDFGKLEVFGQLQ